MRNQEWIQFWRLKKGCTHQYGINYHHTYQITCYTPYRCFFKNRISFCSSSTFYYWHKNSTNLATYTLKQLWALLYDRITSGVIFSHLCIVHSKIKIYFQNETIFNHIKYTHHHITGNQGTRIDLNTATSACITFFNFAIWLAWNTLQIIVL